MNDITGLLKHTKRREEFLWRAMSQWEDILLLLKTENE